MDNNRSGLRKAGTNPMMTAFLRLLPRDESYKEPYNE